MPMEPVTYDRSKISDEVMQTEAMVSIAISLKRIADMTGVEARVVHVDDAEMLASVLRDARRAIASLDEADLGRHEDGFIRDELLAKIDWALVKFEPEKA